jgi:hypothetical protein
MTACVRTSIQLSGIVALHLCDAWDMIIVFSYAVCFGNCFCFKVLKPEEFYGKVIWIKYSLYKMFRVGEAVIVISWNTYRLLLFPDSVFYWGEIRRKPFRGLVYFSLEGVRQDTAVSNDMLLFACLSGVKWLNNGGACWVTTVWKTVEGRRGVLAGVSQ